MRGAWLLGVALGAVALGALPGDARAAAGEASFSPVSVRVPIRRIQLEGSGAMGSGGMDSGAMGSGAMGGPQVVYECAGASEDDCLVDLADEAALAALFQQPAAITPGVYNQITILTCYQEGRYHVRFKGQVEIGGVMRYTRSGPVPLSQDEADYGYVSAEHQGCGYSFPLGMPLLLQAGDDVQLSAFFTLRDIAWGMVGHGMGSGGCFDDGTEAQGHRDATAGACIAYPNLVPYAGALAPTLEAYHVGQAGAPLSQANGQLLLIAGGDGRLLGGFTRRLYSEASASPMLNWDTPLRRIEDNGDGSFLIESIGGYGPGGMGMIDYYIQFSAFQRRSHDGELRSGNDPVGAPARRYHAERVGL